MNIENLSLIKSLEFIYNKDYSRDGLYFKDETTFINYNKELTKQKRLRDVRLLFANSGDIDGSPVVQFSVSAFPVGNLPIVETGKQKKK